jgi:predicted dehydrogenase
LRKLGEQVSFCSRDKNKAAAFLGAYGGAAAYNDLADAFADPDIQSCVICVPYDLHELYAAAAVGAKRHVLLEKPLADTMDSAQRIVTLAAASGRAFMLAEQMDYAPVLATVRRLANPVSYTFTDHNDYQPSGWRMQTGASGGVLLDLGVHYVSFAAKAFGPIASHRRESAGRVSIRHVNGVEGVVDVAWMQPAAARSMEVKTQSSLFRYRQDSRIAMLGSMPQLVCVRAANGREQMTREYLSRCRSSAPVSDIADALPVLAAVL